LESRAHRFAPQLLSPLSRPLLSLRLNFSNKILLHFVEFGDAETGNGGLTSQEENAAVGIKLL
jgi:hypothetical protein